MKGEREGSGVEMRGEGRKDEERKGGVRGE